MQENLSAGRGTFLSKYKRISRATSSRTLLLVHRSSAIAGSLQPVLLAESESKTRDEQKESSQEAPLGEVTEGRGFIAQRRKNWTLRGFCVRRRRTQS